MKYPAEQLEAVAAEYVLGTLGLAARRRMTQLMIERDDARQAVWRWERALGGLCHDLQPVTPPDRVYAGIRRKIEPQPTTQPERKRRWAWLAGALPVAAAFLLFIVLQPQTAPDFERAAIVSDDTGVALWVIKADLDAGTLNISARGATAAQRGKDYELWLLPAGGAPVSLGLLDAADISVDRALNAAALMALPDTPAVAVSLEPRGGSTTGAPTGPVLYQAKLVTL
ncbi:MAG: anti-sigma factor [Gammaproteobacteria bacterium]